MNQPLAIENRVKPIGDAFAAGVAVMLAINIIQRIVGLARNLGFSWLLPEDQLGLWSMANSFFVIAPPFIVLGLPGSFGKFVEHYRQQGDVQIYLRRVGVVCSVALVLAAVAMLLAPTSTGLALYGQDLPYAIIVWTVVTLVVLTAHNFLYDVVLSYRQVRLVSLMQFVNSLTFSVLGLAGIWWTRSWAILLPCFTLAYLMAMIPGLYGLSLLRSEARSGPLTPARGMWRRIVPFAIALWATNLLTNAFELSDRYMLLHFSSFDSQVGQAHVGQFYCGRIIPNLLLSLAMMLSGILLPYLSADWERKQYDRISQSVNQGMVLLSVVFTGLSVGALTTAPFLFHWFFAGRFDPALQILPLGLMQATWSGITMLASAYLMCAEKGRQNALMLAIGLGLNIGLNWPFIQWFGLYGAALATTCSNAVLLLLICWRLNREGCPIQLRTLVVCALPFSLLTGVYVSSLLFVLLAIACSRTQWLLKHSDREAIDQWICPRIQRLGLSIRSIW